MENKQFLDYQKKPLYYVNFYDGPKYGFPTETDMSLENVPIEERNREVCKQYVNENLYDLWHVPLSFIDEEMFIYSYELLYADISDVHISNDNYYDVHISNVNYYLNFILYIFIENVSTEFLNSYKYKLWKPFEKDKIQFKKIGRGLLFSYFHELSHIPLYSVKRTCTHVWFFGIPDKYKNDEKIMINFLSNEKNYKHLPEQFKNYEFHKKLYEKYKYEFYKNKLRKYILNHL